MYQFINISSLICEQNKFSFLLFIVFLGHIIAHILVIFSAIKSEPCR